MAKDLAEHYRTVWVPEYGREYCQAIEDAGENSWTHTWTSEEFIDIAQTQQEREERMPLPQASGMNVTCAIVPPS
jgi:hypothetical protein